MPRSLFTTCYAAYQAYAEVAGRLISHGMNNDRRLALDTAKALYHFREHVPQLPYKHWQRAYLPAVPSYGLLREHRGHCEAWHSSQIGTVPCHSIEQITGKRLC